MRSFIFRSTSFLSRQVLPSLLIIALVFAPFPPLLLPSEQSEQNAKQAYESTYGPNNPASTVVARYTRGISEPTITKDTTDSVVSLVMDPNTALLPLVAEELAPEAPARLATSRSARVSPSAQANVAAALQVANGTSASEVVEVGLDSSFNITETVDTHGARTLAEYNEAGDPVKITAPDGRVTYYAYDEAGNLTSMYSEKSKVVARRGENPLAFLSRIFTSSMRALAGEDSTNSTALTYEEGAITEVKADNSAVSFEYDADGNLSAQEIDSGESIVYAYDEEGNIAGKEVHTLDTTVAQNSLTRVLARMGLTGLARSYARAYAGTETLAQSEAYGYDTSGELSAFSVSLGDEVVDQPAPTPLPVIAPEPAVQPVIESVVPTASTSDAVPSIEVPAITLPEATTTADAVISFLKSPIKLLTYALAPFVPRALADVVEEVVSSAQETSTPVPASDKSIGVWNTRDVLGNIAETQNEKGEITSYRYDSRTDAPTGRTVYDPQGAVLIDISYGFDSSSNRWTSRNEAGNTESYEYDQSGQLSRVAGLGTDTYSYDERGNRVERTGTDGTASYTYVGNRLQKETSASGSTRTYTYNEAGNVATVDGARGTTRFSYEPRGAVSNIELPDGTNIRYSYDALNRRISKSVVGPAGTESLTYRYEGANLTRVVGADGTTLRQYLYDPKNNLIAIVTGGATYSVVLDSHGSVIALTDQSSQVAARFNYDAWGAPTSALRPDLTDFYYTSGFYEPLIGMYLLGPRTYDPTIGRFLQKDPLAGSLMDAISQNEYLYAGNDPINRTDPTGHQSVEANVGSSPRALAAQARAAAEEMGTVVSAANAQVALLTANNAPAEQIAVAQEAYEAAKGAQKDMSTLARDNEARVEELESAARAALLLEQAAIPPVVVTEATTTPGAVPTDSAASTTPVAEVPVTEASTTVPVTEPVVPASPTPTPESTTPIEQVPAVPPTPEAVTVPAEPITFIGATGQVVLSAFEDFAPLAFAKKKSRAKSAKKKSPPPPKKKSKAKAAPPPPKLTKKQKQEQAKKDMASLVRSVAKLTAAIASLNKTIAEKKVVILPTVAKVAQATKVQAAEVAVAPQVPSSKKDPVSAFTAGATIVQTGTSFVSSAYAYLSTEAGRNNALSVGVSLIPVVGEGYDIVTLLAGKDPITKESLTEIGVTFTVIGLASGVGSGKIARDTVTLALEKLAKELGVSLNDLTPIALEVASKYNVKSLADFQKIKGKLSIDSFMSEVRIAAKSSDSYLQTISGKYQWGNWSTLKKHTVDHADDFGLKPDDYEGYARKAYEFVEKGKLGAAQKGWNPKHGSQQLYDNTSNTFAAYDPVTLKIKTFFVPGPDYIEHLKSVGEWK